MVIQGKGGLWCLLVVCFGLFCVRLSILAWRVVCFVFVLFLFRFCFVFVQVRSIDRRFGTCKMYFVVLVEHRRRLIPCMVLLSKIVTSFFG